MSDIIVATDHDFRHEIAAKEVSDYIGPLLANTYPGYRWRVEPDAKNGIVDIRCEHTNCKFGYTLIPSRYFSETQWRAAIIKAGGEILERFNMSRRGFDAVDFLTRERDFAGLIHPDM
jgi:hypothetical protein